MHLETISDSMLHLSKKLGFLHDFSFYLAGGTGLALQIGHRRSFDLDFFTAKEFSPDELAAVIKKHNLSTEGEMQSHGTLYCIIEGVKTSFIFYDCLLIFPQISLESITIADWRDIVTEKLRTVGDRGQKKDFFDLYFGVQKMGIDNIVESAYKKFGKNVNFFHLVKGLTYFEDAEKNPDPLLLDKSASWNEVKNFFMARFQDFENAFIRITR